MFRDKLIFAIFDNMVKENIIPNGFGMSVEELDRHRLRIHGKANVKFKIEKISQNIIPIHKSTYKHNPKFFKKHGEIIYFIFLNRDFDHYIEFTKHGMNFWLNFLDEDTVDLLLKEQIKVVITCSLEVFPLREAFQFIRATDRSTDRRLKYEVWTPFAPPIKNKKLIATVYKELSKDDPYFANSSVEKLMNDFNYDYKRFEEVVKDVPYWEIYVKKTCPLTDLQLEKTKKYICLCRRYTDDRLLTHAYIVANNLLDLGYNSIPAVGTVDKNRKLSDSVQFLGSKFSLFKNETEAAINFWKTNSPGIVLDQQPISDTDRTIYSGNHNGFKDPPNLEKYYAETYFSLVGEGDTRLGTFMLTEKIYRSIFYKHMFIIIGSYGVLESLKEKGYKTFDKLWSENYDLIIDDQLRWKTALEQFKEIVTNKNIHKLYSSALPIIEHNYKNMILRIEKYQAQYN